MSEETKLKLIDCGGFGYPVAKTANITDLPVADIEKAMKEKKGEIYDLIKKGQDIFDYQIDKRLMEGFMQGDLKALSKLELRQKKKLKVSSI